jgi:hypothetical protein
MEIISLALLGRLRKGSGAVCLIVGKVMNPIVQTGGIGRLPF